MGSKKNITESSWYSTGERQRQAHTDSEQLQKATEDPKASCDAYAFAMSPSVAHVDDEQAVSAPFASSSSDGTVQVTEDEALLQMQHELMTLTRENQDLCNRAAFYRETARMQAELSA